MAALVGCLIALMKRFSFPFYITALLTCTSYRENNKTIRE